MSARFVAARAVVVTITVLVLSGAPAVQAASTRAGRSAPAPIDVPQASVAARVMSLSGDVHAERHDLGEPRSRRPLSADDAVSAGDTVTTGSRAAVHLRFVDGTVVSLGAGTRFRVDTYVFDEVQQRGFFSLVEGMLEQVTGRLGKRNPDDYRLTTPTATIGIRGTRFIALEHRCTGPRCTVARSTSLHVDVLDGRIVMTNAAGQLDVVAGQSAEAGDAHAAPRLVPSPRTGLDAAAVPRHHRSDATAADRDGTGVPAGRSSRRRADGLSHGRNHIIVPPR